VKIADIRKKSESELKDILSRLRDETRVMRFKVSSKEVKNHQLLKGLKKDIARILTNLKERENGPEKE